MFSHALKENTRLNFAKIMCKLIELPNWV